MIVIIEALKKNRAIDKHTISLKLLSVGVDGISISTYHRLLFYFGFFVFYIHIYAIFFIIVFIMLWISYLYCHSLVDRCLIKFGWYIFTILLVLKRVSWKLNFILTFSNTIFFGFLFWFFCLQHIECIAHMVRLVDKFVVGCWNVNM